MSSARAADTENAPGAAAFGLAASTTRGEATRHLARLFDELGITSAKLDARVLVGAATSASRTELIANPDAPLGQAYEALLALARRRLAREPISRILGKREFWGLDFSIDPHVLDPRADSETLVEAALREFEGRHSEPLFILDLGLGSGALLAALLKEMPRATGIGVERSTRAARLARQNLRGLGLLDRAAVVVSDWSAPIAGAFDLVVSNPPYIATGDIAALDPEVRDHDPFQALDGGHDGLAAYRTIAPAASRLLRANGLICVECGLGQADAIAGILRLAGLTATSTARDLAGVERVVMARANA